MREVLYQFAIILSKTTIISMALTYAIQFDFLEFVHRKCENIIGMANPRAVFTSILTLRRRIPSDATSDCRVSHGQATS